jgi:cell wall-associated NlpC family hydrolase
MRSLVVLAVSLAVVACGSAADPGSLSGSGVGTPTADTYGAQVNESNGPTGDVGDPGDGTVLVVDDSVKLPPDAPTTFAVQTMVTTANLNLRKSPSASSSVLLVIPSGSVVTVLDPTAQNGFLHISFNGTSGWSSTAYLTTPAGGSSSSTSPSSPSSPSVGVDGAPSPDNAVARASASVGFSYWWGGGAWLAAGPTSSSKGTCSGSCPSCSHSGQYGADCSGMVAKAWQFGTKALETNSHPYSTATFVNDSPGKWSTVSRGALKKGDALVYNSGGAGHIVLWEKGDGWGSSTVYECKGCSYGCVHDTRTFSSSYKGIRRAGF